MLMEGKNRTLQIARPTGAQANYIRSTAYSAGVFLMVNLRRAGKSTASALSQRQPLWPNTDSF
jgi:hypothetical protein